MKTVAISGWRVFLNAAFILFAVVALCACNFGKTPVTENTPVPEVSSFPKSGHWAGESGTKDEANVSFYLSDGGSISNFSMKTSLGTPTSECEIAIDQIQMQVNEDDTFSISYLMEYAEVEKQLGAAVMSLGVIPEGEPYEVLRIEGTTTDAAMNGTYTIRVCGATLYLGNNTGSWKSQWKNP